MLGGLTVNWAQTLVAVLVTLVVGYGLTTFGPTNPEIPAPAQHPLILPNEVGVFPEPLDRFLFFSMVTAIPLVLGGVALLGARLKSECADPAPVFWSLLALLLTTCALRGAVPEIARLFTGGQWLVTLICAVAVGWLYSTPSALYAARNRNAFWLVLGIAIAMIAAQRIWILDSAVYHNGPFTSHYEAVTSALVRIAGGSTCLVDVIPQYGCSGEILAPWLKLVGSTVFAITLTLVALTAIALAAAMNFARSLLERPLFLSGSLLSLTIVVALNLVYDIPDPIFQYYPIRFLFPAGSLIVAMWYQRAPGLFRSSVLGLFSGISLAWNLESGVAVTGSLAFWVLLGQFTTRPWHNYRQLGVLVLRLLAFSCCVALILLLFKFHLAEKSGITPDFTKYFLFQRVFYLIGFGMLPIPPFPDYWSVYAGVLFSTGLLAALWIGSTSFERDLKLERAVYLAVLGTGLFLYYSGRSHLLVLRLVAWPATILFFFLLERATGAVKGPQGRRILNVIGLLSCFLPTAFLAMTLPAVIELARTVRNPPSTENAMMREDIAFIRANAAPAERIAIIAINQSVLYGESGMRAQLEGPSVAEMIRVADRDAQVEALIVRGPDKFFWGSELIGAVARGQLGTEIGIDLALIGTAYALVKIGPGERLLLFRRKPFEGEDQLDAYLARTREAFATPP